MTSLQRGRVDPDQMSVDPELTRRQRVLRSRLRSPELAQAREVVVALESGRYVSASGALVDVRSAVEASRAGTHCASAAVERAAPSPGEVPARVSVVADTTIGAALELAQRHRRLGLLNFASATNRGGGWSAGAKAQEEDLVRSTTILECLERAGDDFYEAHEHADPATFADVCLHSPGVLVIRDGGGGLLDVPVPVSVLTCAAPRADLLGAAERSRLAPLLLGRLRLVLRTAAAAGDRALVLGAWGCGAYGNDTAVVAATFRDLLDGDLGRCFDEIVFAIADREPGRPTLLAFRDALAPGG